MTNPTGDALHANEVAAWNAALEAAIAKLEQMTSLAMGERIGREIRKLRK